MSEYYTSIDLPSFQDGDLSFLLEDDVVKEEVTKSLSPVPNIENNPVEEVTNSKPRKSPFSVVKAMSPKCDRNDYKNPLRSSIINELPSIDFNVVNRDKPSPSVERSPVKPVKTVKPVKPTTKLAKPITTNINAYQPVRQRPPSIDVSLFCLIESGFLPFNIILPDTCISNEFIVMCYTKYMHEFAVVIDSTVDIISQMDDNIKSKYSGLKDNKSFTNVSKFDNIIQCSVKQIYTSDDAREANCDEMAKTVGNAFNKYSNNIMWNKIIGAISYSKPNDTYLRVTINPQNVNNQNLSPNTRSRGAPEFFIYSKNNIKTVNIPTGVCPILSMSCFMSKEAVEEAILEIKKCNSENVNAIISVMHKNVHSMINDYYVKSFLTKFDEISKSLKRVIKINKDNLDKDNTIDNNMITDSFEFNKSCFEFYANVYNILNSSIKSLDEKMSYEMCKCYIQYKTSDSIPENTNLDDPSSLDFPETWGLKVGDTESNIDLNEKVLPSDTVDLKTLKKIFSQN